MGRGAVPKYRRRSDGYAFIEHRTIPTKSHRMVIGRYGSEESLAAYTKFLDGLRGVTVVKSPGKWPTITQLVEAYMIYAEGRYMRADGLTSEYDGMRHALGALEFVGNLSSDQFTNRTLATIRGQLARQGYYRNTVNHMLSRIKKFFRWCCENELCPSDLYSRLVSVRGLMKGEEGCLESDPVQPAAPESITGILPYLTTTLAAMVQIQFMAGMRPEEVCRLRGDRILREGEIWFYQPEKHKNQWRGSASIKAIPPKAQRIVAPFLETKPYCFRTAKGGDRYTVSGYRQALERAFAAAEKRGAKLTPFKPNQLRHSIATHIAQKLGHRAAQAWCGHDQPNTTAIYIKTQMDELTQIAQLLEADWSVSE